MKYIRGGTDDNQRDMKWYEMIDRKGMIDRYDRCSYDRCRYDRCRYDRFRYDRFRYDIEI